MITITININMPIVIVIVMIELYRPRRQRCRVRQVEMLNVLQDIGEAQTLLSSTDGAKKGKGKAKTAAVPTVPHPTDVNYEALNADLSLLSPQSQEYKTIK